MNRLDFADIPGPQCGYCNRPVLVCGTTPCDGMCGHLADVILRMHMSGERKAAPVPLVKGGQGRRRAEVEAYANTVCILVFVCLVSAALVWWGAR